MKKTIFAIILAVAMLVTAIIPAFAEEEEKVNRFVADGYNVNQYYVDIVDAGAIKVDGVLDDAYLNSTKIESNEEAPYIASAAKNDPSIAETLAGSFYSYVVISEEGMYVYGEIEDNTVWETLHDSDANTGDLFQMYFDWCPAEYMHPTPEARAEMEAAGNKWDFGTYKSTYASGLSGMQYLGWLSVDYAGNVAAMGGFSPADQIGEDFEGIKHAETKIEGGWTCEIFIPWRDSEQKEAIKAGEQFHCGFGIQVSEDCNDADGKDYRVGIKFDQHSDLGLVYYNDYSTLADIIWTGETPPIIDDEPTNPGTSDSIIAIVAALAVSGAGIAMFAKKKEN